MSTFSPVPVIQNRATPGFNRSRYKNAKESAAVRIDCAQQRGMLKSCVRSREVLLLTCPLTVRKTLTVGYVVVPSQLRQQARHKSSNASGQRKRWGDKKRTLGATEPQDSSITDTSLREPRTQPPPESRILKSKPVPSSQAEHIHGFRPLRIDPVKPTPNQDLSSTRPAELEAVEAPAQGEDGSVPIANRAKYLFRLGKSYVNFYKTGLKNIWYNRKEYNKIKARLGPHHPTHAALYGGQVIYRNENGNQVEIGRVPEITRREYQLYLRTKHDLRKLIPFGLVFAICGEFTPLVILALGSSIVPFTCRIPQQVQHDRRWFMKRLEDNTLERVLTTEEQTTAKIMPLDSPDLINSVAFLHGVSPFARLPPIIGKVLFHSWIYPRLRLRGSEILADTALIRREGGFSVLEPIEVFEYANKFFCPQLIFASQLSLKRSNTIDWPPETASSLGKLLEVHASLMLAQDWERIPEEDRYQSGLIFDSGTLARFKDVEAEVDRTGKLPW